MIGFMAKRYLYEIESYKSKGVLINNCYNWPSYATYLIRQSCSMGHLNHPSVTRGFALFRVNAEVCCYDIFREANQMEDTFIKHEFCLSFCHLIVLI